MSDLLERVVRSSVVGIAFALLLVTGPVPAHADAGTPCGQDCKVGPTPGRDEYRGALLLPPSTRSSHADLVDSAAHCADCIWRLRPACLVNNPDPDLLCLNALASCPDPGILMAIWLQRPPDPVFRRVGSFCHQPGEALTPEQFVPGVRDQFVKLLPPLGLTYQPRGRGLVNLPTLFDTHQPPDLGRPRFVLGGHPIVLTATARWTFDFGDGAVGDFDRPGGSYPDVDIAHPYRQPGTFTVTVITTWTGQFTVDGLGPFPVTGPDIVQRQTVALPVKEARATLVG